MSSDSLADARAIAARVDAAIAQLRTTIADLELLRRWIAPIDSPAVSEIRAQCQAIGLTPRATDHVISVVQMPPDSCWIWPGHRDPHGYGRIHFTKAAGPRRKAHRVLYEMLVNPIPAGLYIDHLCRVPSCVNPRHLEPVTSRTNTLRGETNAAENTEKTACPAGHPYDEKNTYVSPDRRRHCRTCFRAVDRARQPRRVKERAA